MIVTNGSKRQGRTGICCAMRRQMRFIMASFIQRLRSCPNGWIVCGISKSLAIQVGAGFMVGSPGQTDDCLAEDLVFLQKLKPQMVGIGPFNPTP